MDKKKSNSVGAVSQSAVSEAEHMDRVVMERGVDYSDLFNTVLMDGVVLNQSSNLGPKGYRLYEVQVGEHTYGVLGLT